MTARTPIQIREAAAGLVERHAARLGMDSYAAAQLVDTIRALSLDDGQPDADGWIFVGGVKPDLPADQFVIARYGGESRAESEAWRAGYGEPVHAIRWHAVEEYRHKNRTAAA